MHARSSAPGALGGFAGWLLVAAVLVALALMAIAWDQGDLGDGLVMGKDASVKSVWDLAQGRDAPDNFFVGGPMGGSPAAGAQASRTPGPGQHP